MAVLFNGTTINGTSTDDIILGYPGAQGDARNHTIFGGGGDDLIYGDYDYFRTGSNFGTSRATATNLTDTPAIWGRGENQDIVNASTIAHASVVVQSTGNTQWFRLDMKAGQQLAVDVDYGNNVIGGSFDGRLEIRNAANQLVYSNDNSATTNGALGSASTADPFILTEPFQTAGTYYVRLSESDGSGVPSGGTAVVNFTIANYGTTAAEIFGSDRLFGGDGADRLYGMRGNDSLSGGSGIDALYGGSGNDLIDGGASKDAAFGNNGNDIFAVGASQFGDNTYGGRGIDTLDLSRDDTARTVNLSAGTHVFRANIVGTNDEFRLASIENVIGSRASDSITGTAGVNALRGAQGNDGISAGAGADRLDGGFGNDLLIGGTGADTFRFASGADRIADFENNLDTLALDNALWGNRNFTRAQVLDRYANDVGNDVVFTFANGQTLRIEDFAIVGNLENDIVFV